VLRFPRQQTRISTLVGSVRCWGAAVCPRAAVVGAGWECDRGWVGMCVSACVTITVFHCRVLCKFAFSLSQDWELPVKREVSRCHLSVSFSAGGFCLLPPPPSFVLQPILCLLWSRDRRLWMGPLSLPGQAGRGSCVAVLAEGAACPCPAGAEGNGGSLPAPVLPKPQGLSPFQLRRGGKHRAWALPADATSPSLGVVN